MPMRRRVMRKRRLWLKRFLSPLASLLSLDVRSRLGVWVVSRLSLFSSLVVVYDRLDDCILVSLDLERREGGRGERKREERRKGFSAELEIAKERRNLVRISSRCLRGTVKL